MDVLKRYGAEDLRKMATMPCVQMMRACGHVLAAQGRAQEALAKFKEGLDIERGQ
jgi:hypothetical protein